MRRVRSALILGVLCELMWPAPAHAWWDILDQLSGPGRFKGVHLEARLVCFTEPAPKIDEDPGRSEGRKASNETLGDDVTDRNLSGGVTYSACAVREGQKRRASLDLGFRFLRFTDVADSNRFAGGNEIALTTLVPSFSWRVFSDRRFDVVDAGVGAGVYWFSSRGANSGGFESFSGVILEPVRLDFHAPSVLTRNHWWAAIPNLRFGLLVFPDGFKANAFGPALTADKARPIGAEWLKNFGIFFDLDPIVRHFSTN
jgi:hypothetical protein